MRPSALLTTGFSAWWPRRALFPSARNIVDVVFLYRRIHQLKDEGCKSKSAHTPKFMPDSLERAS
jgi:hypothetical protein